jgi:hypothetical protein
MIGTASFFIWLPGKFGYRMNRYLLSCYGVRSGFNFF